MLIRVCATQRDRDFGATESERGIHFRDVSYILESLDGSTFRISSGKMGGENKEHLTEPSRAFLLPFVLLLLTQISVALF